MALIGTVKPSKGAIMARNKGQNYLFVEHFKDSYKALGFTQETLSEKIGVSPETLKNWMGRKTQRPIPLDMAKRLADVLDVDVWEIIGTDGRSSFKTRHLDGLAVASAFVERDEQLIATLLSRHGRQPLFESDTDELNAYKGEYLDVLLNSLLTAHDQFVKMADIAEKHGRHKSLLHELDS